MLSRLLLIATSFFALAALCAHFSGKYYQSAIEQDLSSKVEAVLESHDLAVTAIQFTGHQLNTENLSPSIATELDNIIGAYIPPIKPIPHETASWISISEGKDDLITVAGILPSQDDRVAILNAARQASSTQDPSRKISDNIEINSRAIPLGHQYRLISLIPRLLNQADGASLSTRNGVITLRGMLDDSSQIPPLLRGLPAESAFKIQPRQHIDFKIIRSAEKITLSGTLPNGAVRASLHQLIESASDQPTIQDETTVALRPGGSWWSDYPEQFLPAFLNHSSGPAELHFLPRQIHARASFQKKEDRSTMIQLINKLPLQIVRQINLELLPPPPTEPEPTPMLAALGSGNQLSGNPEPSIHLSSPVSNKPTLPEGSPSNLPIFFNKKSTYLKPSEWTKVELLAQLILSNEEPAVLISGSSSFQADPQTNQSLALLRAKEVRKRLIKLGVPAKIMETRALPFDENITDPAKGRRVEISILTS